MKSLGLLLLGAGIGAVLGTQLGEPAFIPAVGVAIAGMVFYLIRPRPARAAVAVEAPADQLGSRVETILRLAEEQAADRIAEANVTAEKIVAEARAREKSA